MEREQPVPKKGNPHQATKKGSRNGTNLMRRNMRRNHQWMTGSPLRMMGIGSPLPMIGSHLQMIGSHLQMIGNGLLIGSRLPNRRNPQMMKGSPLPLHPNHQRYVSCCDKCTPHTGAKTKPQPSTSTLWSPFWETNQNPNKHRLSIFSYPEVTQLHGWCNQPPDSQSHPGATTGIHIPRTAPHRPVGSIPQAPRHE